MTSLSEKQAAYAQWRARMKTGVEANQVIDLTGEGEETGGELGNEWSTESLFAAVDDDEG
jgi:hypothetical protein